MGKITFLNHAFIESVDMNKIPNYLYEEGSR